MLQTAERTYKTFLAHKQTVATLERNYLKNEAGSTYIVNEDMDHFFTSEEVNYFIQERKKGRTISSIAKSMNRDPDEVFLLHFDRKRRKRKKVGPGMYMVNEEMDHFFTHDEVGFLEEEWDRGKTVPAIAKSMKRDSGEVFLLFFDRMRKRQKEISNNPYDNYEILADYA